MQEVGAGSNSFRRASHARPRRPAAPGAIGASHDNPRPRSRRRRSTFRKLGSGVAACLAAFILTSIFASDANRVRLLTDRIPEIDTAISFAGFGIDQVTVKGHRFALVSDILDALQLDKARSFASFDASAARGRIEAFSWVASADLRRIYPNQLEVTIREREPFAVWQDGATHSLIDASGRVLTRINDADAPAGLPRFAGAGAPKAASELWGQLERHPEIKALFLSAERIGKRRWNLNLANHTVIELPASGASAALARLKGWPGFAAISQTGNALVDMRASGRIAVRRADAIGATSSGPQSIAELLDPAG